MIYIAEYAHRLFEKISPANLLLDMTCGRGFDTLYLSKLSKQVLAFDISQEAIASTKTLLEENQVHNVTLIHDDHAHVENHVFGEIDGAIYNLGYLPKSEKEFVTSGLSTITSLEKVLSRVRVGGMVVIVVYQKHTGNEAMEVKHFCSNLPSQQFDVLQYAVLNKELAPYVIEITKIS